MLIVSTLFELSDLFEVSAICSVLSALFSSKNSDCSSTLSYIGTPDVGSFTPEYNRAHNHSHPQNKFCDKIYTHRTNSVTRDTPTEQIILETHPQNKFCDRGTPTFHMKQMYRLIDNDVQNMVRGWDRCSAYVPKTMSAIFCSDDP